MKQQFNKEKTKTKQLSITSASSSGFNLDDSMLVFVSFSLSYRPLEWKQQPGVNRINKIRRSVCVCVRVTCWLALGYWFCLFPQDAFVLVFVMSQMMAVTRTLLSFNEKIIAMNENKRHQSQNKAMTQKYGAPFTQKWQHSSEVVLQFKVGHRASPVRRRAGKPRLRRPSARTCSIP